MREITIEPRKNSSITQQISLKLGRYTILAGENNAGKTHLMNALREKIGEKNVIYIPAEKISAEEQIKTGAAVDPMRAAIAKLVNVTVENMPNIDYEAITHLFENVSETFKSFDVTGTELQLSKKEFTEDDVKKAVHDAVAKKVLEVSVLDTHNKSGGPISLSVKDASQGTQRLIVASVLQELGKVGVSGDEIFILFEEPEIYLHPRLKKKLYKSLRTLSEGPERKVSVVISTHDPYFIELGKGQRIYQVSRDPDKEYSTNVKKVDSNSGVLGYESDAEVNYLIFGVASTDYFLQLYQKAEESRKTNGFDREKMIGNNTLFEIRSAVAHKTKKLDRNTGQEKPDVTEDMKKEAIDYLRDILQAQQNGEAT